MEMETDSIWKAFHKGLRAFIATRIGNPSDADDILQEVFLRIHRKIGTVKNPGRLTSWIFQITRNAIADHYRAPARRFETPSGQAAERDAAPQTEPAQARNFDTDSEKPRRELSACLGPMIERLPDRYRRAMVLVELEGRSQRAAAEVLGVSISGVKSRVQRGRQKLERMLHDCCRIELDRRRGVMDYEAREKSCRFCGPPSKGLP